MPSKISTQDLPLTEREWESLNTIIIDTKLPERHRARAHALILMKGGVHEDVIANRTGLKSKQQSVLLQTLRTQGLQAALTQLSNRRKASKFPTPLVVQSMKAALRSRPPEGSTKWDLRKLTLVVRQEVPEASTISTETIRNLLRTHLGIESIRQVEPFWLQQVRHHRDTESTP